MATKEVGSQVRKLRKKLRQVENLESTDRDLTPDEVKKVNNMQQDVSVKAWCSWKFLFALGDNLCFTQKAPDVCT